MPWKGVKKKFCRPVQAGCDDQIAAGLAVDVGVP